MWKPIINYEDIYEINEYGEIRRIDSNHILKPYLNNKGYKCISLNKNGISTKFLIHRLVAIHFIPNPNEYPIVLHLDNNKINTYYLNLKWGTYSENNSQAIHDGLNKIPRPDNRIYYGIYNDNDLITVSYGINNLKENIQYPYSTRGLYSNIFRDGIIKYGPYIGMQIKQMIEAIKFY
jgi:hypothetical protein